MYIYIYICMYTEFTTTKTTLTIKYYNLTRYQQNLRIPGVMEL